MREFPVRYAPGDPVTETGWINVLDMPAGEMRCLLACGPFTLAPRDSQEIVLAYIVARGPEALSSVTKLRLASRKAQNAERKKIATFDVADGVYEIKDWVFVPSLGEHVWLTVQKGTDSGVRREMEITADTLEGGALLVHDRPYYFAVTAYAYNPSDFPRVLAWVIHENAFYA
jgi:hypothetical protein